MGRVKGLLFLLYPIFHCHKIKDGGYNNITNTNKVSPTQNTPALQATDRVVVSCYYRKLNIDILYSTGIEEIQISGNELPYLVLT